MLANLNKISLTSIEKAPITQPNIYSLACNFIRVVLRLKGFSVLLLLPFLFLFDLYVHYLFSIFKFLSKTVGAIAPTAPMLLLTLL